MNKQLAEATGDGEIRLYLGRRTRGTISRETANFIIRDLQSAIDQAALNETEMLKRRPTPQKELFEAKLRLDLRDAYGDVYHFKGNIVFVTRRKPEPGTAESVLKYPYQIGSFFVDGAAFDPL